MATTITRPKYYQALMINCRDASQKSITTAIILNLTEEWLKIPLETTHNY
jgi:hypothetical protein